MTRPLILPTALTAALLAAVCATGAAHAQIARGDADIRITAKTSEYLQNEGRGTWTGDVVAIQADTKINADKLTAICGRSGQGSQKNTESCDIEKLIAEGNVLYSAPNDRKIRCDRAEYDTVTHIITMTGDCISTSGDEAVVRGTQIVYNVDEGSARITAGQGRVLSIITPKKKDPAAAPAGTATPAPATPAPAPAAPN